MSDLDHRPSRKISATDAIHTSPAGQSNRRRGKARHRDVQPNSHRPITSTWEVTRLVDERSGDSCLGIDFPTRLHGRGFEVIDDDLAEQPGRVRGRLKKRGAMFHGTKKKQIRFVKKLLNRAAPEPLILAMKPGFREDGFILGKRMLGSARGKYRWRSDAQHLGALDIGDTRGDRDAWNRDVGKVALKSTALSCGIMSGLASCVPSYIEWRMKGSAELKPLISETASFNFEGESGSGKTNISRANAGLIGPPDVVARWDFTRRGLEELAESRNDLPLVLDDTETHVEDSLSLKTAIRYVTQIVPKRASKHIAKKVEKTDLPALSWSNFGLTTSPPRLERIAKGLGWKRTDGERVRFICIPVPPVSRAGIFDRLKGSEAERVEEGKALTAGLERGIAQNYGLIFPLWVKYLLAADRSEKLVKLVDRFVNRVARHADGWETRFARKFGVLYAVGRLAVEAGILPWPKGWPLKAITRCHRRAMRAIRTDQVQATSIVKWLASQSGNPASFLTVKSSTRRAIRFDDRTLGLRTQYRGKAVLAIRDEALLERAGSRTTMKAVITELQRGQMLVGGHGRRRTTQLPVSINLAGRLVNKPRFWLVESRRLVDHVKESSRSK